MTFLVWRATNLTLKEIAIYSMVAYVATVGLSFVVYAIYRRRNRQKPHHLRKRPNEATDDLINKVIDKVDPPERWVP